MPYRIEPYIDRQNHLRAHQSERHFIEQLSARGGALKLDNVIVDIEQVILRAFQCDPLWCLRTKGEGADKRHKGCCCTDLQVDLTDEEVARMQQLGELGGQKLKLSARDPLTGIVRRLRSGNFVETNEKGEQIIKHLRSRCCPSGWVDKDGRLLCGLNALCEKLDLPLTHYKSDPCFLFPLHYVEFEPGMFFMTLICEETYESIGSHVIVARLRCLRTPKPGAPPAYVSLKNEIILCFGQKFYNELARAAAPILNKHTAARQATEHAAR